MSRHGFATKQRGVSLVELMIAMLLGLFLLVGVIQVFVSSKSTYNTQESLSRVQESGRHAITMLARDVRMIGYTGCGGRSASVYNHLDPDPGDEEFLNDFTAGMYGSEAADSAPGDELDLNDSAPANGWDPALPAGTGTVETGDDLDPLPGSDVFLARTMSSSIFRATPPGGNDIGGASQFGVVGSHDFEAGEILVVSDCARSAIVQIGNMSGNNVSYGGGGGGNEPGNKNNPNWGPEDHIIGDASVGRVESRVYFVANNDDDVPTLYSQLLSGNQDDPRAVAEGIESMQILYGVRGTGTGVTVDEFLTADAVDAANQWEDVTAAQISLLVRSEQRLPGGIADRARTFDLGGFELTVEPDGRQRQIFRATVTLRNRAL